MQQEITKLREGWLQHAASFLTTHMAQYGLSCPKVRVSCGWPSRRALSNKTRVIGECFRPEMCADGTPQIFISPLLANSVEVLGVLLHELIHAAVGCKHGHKKPFSQAARRMGLTGRATATTVGDTLRPILESYVAGAGAYPHAAIVLGGKAAANSEDTSEESKRPGSRLRLYECECEPVIKVRVASDSFQAKCILCNACFHRAR
jgi:hypothetical protein